MAGEAKAMLAFATSFSLGCDEILARIAKARESQKCDLKTGLYVREGGAGGAIYILEQENGYLPIEATIEGSKFSDDVSLHEDRKLRAEIVVQDCSTLSLSSVDVTATGPTTLKVVLQRVSLRNAGGSAIGVTCSPGKLISTDRRVRVTESTCQ